MDNFIPKQILPQERNPSLNNENTTLNNEVKLLKEKITLADEKIETQRQEILRLTSLNNQKSADIDLLKEKIKATQEADRLEQIQLQKQIELLRENSMVMMP